MAHKGVQSEQGGTGVLSGDDSHARAETRLAVRAVERGWPISDEKRRQVAEEMAKVAADPATKPRTRANAVRVLALLDSLNLRDLHHRERMAHEDGILDLRMRRAEKGMPNDCVQVNVAPAERLPEPEWLEKRRKMLGAKEN